jgi:uncharacterized protein
MVILRQVDVARYLPVWVGPFEAESIGVALQEVEMARPLTHDLLKNVFLTFKATILRIEINQLKDNVFFGNIIVEYEGKLLAIDSRPSDAIALAVRVHAPILVSQAVMDEAAIVPESDIQAEPASNLDEESSEPPLVDEKKRLDIFDDFLKKLDKDRGSEENPNN